jgi:hypothetical protein
VYLFPERDDRGGRRLLPITLIVSLLVHLAIVGGWLYFDRHVIPAIAKLLPRPSPTPELVALSDAITIEKRSVPRPSRRTQPQRRPQPRPRQVAQVPAPRLRIPVPTLAPVPTVPPTAAPTRVPTVPPTTEPTSEPTTAPTYRPLRGTIHHPRAEPTPAPRELPTVAPRAQRSVAQPSSKNGFSPQQIAALDAQFSRTIAQAQRALTDVPPQRRPPARSPDQRRYDAVMAGTPEQFLSAQGECQSIQAAWHGSYVDRYLRCVIQYSDGYFEEVSFPWVFRFTRRGDPFQYSDGSYHPFPMQPPPDGFALPHPFALSRAICSFYRAQCESVIQRERANGNQPATENQ